mgnify:CR=1 FL=1
MRSIAENLISFGLAHAVRENPTEVKNYMTSPNR